MRLTIRALTRELRRTHEAYAHPDAGGESVCLRILGNGHWLVSPPERPEPGVTQHGLEPVPGDGKPFDAVAAARRLLAAYLDFEDSR